MKTILSNHLASVLSVVMAVSFLVATATLFSCNKKEQLVIQQDFPFEVTVMPIPKDIGLGQRIEIRVKIKHTGDFTDTQQHVRYFQNEGYGFLGFDNQDPFIPNESYPLPGDEFKLYYTSNGSADHAFDVWITDNFENEKKLTIKLLHRGGRG